MKPHHRRHLGWLLAVILLLAIARALLPYAMKHYLNARMDRMGDYHGQIADISLHLWRGGYTIEGLRIVKTTGKVPAPLLDTPCADIELSWFALGHGVFRGKVNFTAPTINFVEGHGDQDSQTGKGVDWRAELKLLAPMRLDEINVSNGTVTFQSFVSNPRVDLKMTDVNGTVTNLTNIQRRKGNRVATLHATAKILVDAPFETDATFDPPWPADCASGSTRCRQAFLYMAHGLGHGIGLEVHDAGGYSYSPTGTFQLGEVFTIEPGIYISNQLLDMLPDTPKNRAFIARVRPAVQRYHDIGVRIEDDYIVTATGADWISRGPREIAEVEAVMRRATP